MLDGDLLTNQVEQVLLDLGAQQATGCLTVLDAAAEEAEVYLKEGLVYSVFVPGRRPLLGSRLMSSGALAPEALAEALEIQRTELQGWRLGELLVHLGYVDRELIESFVSEQLVDMLGDLLGWHVDTWRFRKNKKARQDVAPPTDVPVVLNLVRERRRAGTTCAARSAGPDSVPVLSAGGLADDDVVLGPGEWAMLCKVDGERSVADLAIDCGFTVFEAAEVIAALVRAGLVDVELDDFDLADLEDPEAIVRRRLGRPARAVRRRSWPRRSPGSPRRWPGCTARSRPPSPSPDAQDVTAPAGWQDHLAWVEDQRRQAEDEARTARAEAERLAEEMQRREAAASPTTSSAAAGGRGGRPCGRGGPPGRADPHRGRAFEGARQEGTQGAQGRRGRRLGGARPVARRPAGRGRARGVGRARGLGRRAARRRRGRGLGGPRRLAASPARLVRGRGLGGPRRAGSPTSERAPRTRPGPSSTARVAAEREAAEGSGVGRPPRLAAGGARLRRGAGLGGSPHLGRRAARRRGGTPRGGAHRRRRADGGRTARRSSPPR